MLGGVFKCVKLISCSLAPFSIGLFLLAPVLMAQTPASMCTPLKTLNDNLSHRRRYMVSEWWLLYTHVSGNVYTSNKQMHKCKYTSDKKTAPNMGQTPKTLSALLIMQFPLCLLCLMNVHIYKTQGKQVFIRAAIFGFLQGYVVMMRYDVYNVNNSYWF